MYLRMSAAMFLSLFFLSTTITVVDALLPHEIHECSHIERTFITFDSTSPEEMEKLQRKSRMKDNSKTFEDRPTTFNMDFYPFKIELTPGFGIQHYQEVSRSFLTAKSIWETLLEPTETSSPVNIFIDIQRLAAGVIGSTRNVRIIGNCIQPSGVFPQPMEEKTGITFPDCSKMQFKLPEGFAWDGKFTYEKAHMKALGYSNLDYLFGQDDGQIIFSLLYLNRYDFDVFDGVSQDKLDFLSVAVHEIGHLLGFTSTLDEVDQEMGDDGGAPNFHPSILDVFRFSSNQGGYISFEEKERYSTPDKSHHRFFSPPYMKNVEFSTGMLNGDGNQASHWKDDAISGAATIGAMDPSLTRGIHIPLSVSDTWAFRSIGYEVNTTIPIEVLNYELKKVGNYPKLFISAEFVFSSYMFVHFFKGNSEFADYDCQFDGSGDLRWVCPYPRSDLCSFRVSNPVGKISKKVSLKTDVCR